MSKKIIIQRRRIFLAVEGEGEQSFIKLLQQFSDQNNIHVHLDCEVLNGGGYKVMLERAVSYRSRKEKYKGKAKESVLIVDADRADNKDDPWSLEQLTKKASQKGFAICIQKPNLEGLLLRMLPGNDQLSPNAATAHKLLTKQWQNYQKPADTRTLMSKYSYEDLIRASRSDQHLKDLLIKIGLF
ncbi:MAG: RloB domain-containing protein [Gammaproteobacteria bacterium]